MHGKGGHMPYGGPYPGGLLPHGQTEPQPKSEWQTRFESLDEVDQNLIRELAVRTISMVQEKANGLF